jgi:hypothetical protein
MWVAWRVAALSWRMTRRARALRAAPRLGLGMIARSLDQHQMRPTPETNCLDHGRREIVRLIEEHHLAAQLP